MENNNNQWINWDDVDSSSQTDSPTDPQTLPNQNNLNWNDMEPDQSSTPPNLNWEENLEENNPSIDEDNDPPSQDFSNFDEDSHSKMYSKLGSTTKISINNDIISLNLDIQKILNELDNTDLTSLDEEGRYSVDFSQGEELKKLILTLKLIAKEYNSDLSNCYVYSLKSQDKFLNINKSKPLFSFIYYLKTNVNSNQVIIDLSHIGGPSLSLNTPSPGILNIFPGWLPYSLSANLSEENCIAIGGSFN